MVNQDFFSRVVTRHHAKRLFQYPHAGTVWTILHWLAHFWLLSLPQADPQQITRASQREQMLELICNVALSFTGYDECSKLNIECLFSLY